MVNYKVPSEIVIELTRDCNLDCDFCFNRQGTGSSDSLSTGMAFKILEDISEAGVESVRFTGGEPLLRKDLGRILRKARSLGLYTILNTNALLVNKSNRGLFNDVDLSLFSFHDPANFENLCRSMRLLENFDTKIMLATIATRKNIRNLENFYEQVAGISQQNLVEWFLLRQIPNENDRKPLSRQDIRALFKKMARLNARHKMDVRIANAMPFCAISEDLVSVCKGGGYDSGYSRLVIGCDGKIKTDYSGTGFGDIRRTGIMDAWNSDDIRSIREYGKVSEECRRCYYLGRCKGGLLKKEYLRSPENVSHLASVIIPTFNSPERLSLLIKSLENQTVSNFEVIVVDDGSTDDTRDVVELIKKDSCIDINYHFLDNKEIFGAGIARNFGAKKARADVLVFLDQDNVADPNLIGNHLKEQEKNDVVLGYYAGYGNEMAHYDFRKIAAMVDRDRAPKTIIPEFRDSIFREPEKHADVAWKYFVSANFSIKKGLFQRFRFDEGMKSWGGEDIDLGYRLIKAGHRPAFSGACLSYDTSDEMMMTREKFISNIRNLAYLYDKHGSDELKDYAFERFNTVKKGCRGDSRLVFDGMHIKLVAPSGEAGNYG